MKLPRWLVILLLSSSLMAVLAAGGWCWVSWPKWTARTFTNLLTEGDCDSARQMLSIGSVVAECPAHLWPGLLTRNSTTDIESATMIEGVFGQRRFRFSGFHSEERFIAKWGKVYHSCPTEYHPCMFDFMCDPKFRAELEELLANEASNERAGVSKLTQ